MDNNPQRNITYMQKKIIPHNTSHKMKLKNVES